MLTLSSTIRIFVCGTPTDMRKQFDGLSALVTHTFGKDVMTGDYFVFINRAKNRCKILSWDQDGFAIWEKRLERGRFQFPRSSEQDAVVTEVDTMTLAMVLGGIDLDTAKRRKRYQPAPATKNDTRTATPTSDACLQSAS